ncbi:unnamed protein product [Symbiodinium sp. CCMP2592]|nr:unnamed protein product [Symbiodinium sp. CCMP2592]
MATTDGTGAKVTDACYRCCSTWTTLSPGKDANENGWRSEFSHCCAVHFGDEESNVERPANVLDRQVQGYESYIEFALLSDAEFLELADLPEKTKISSAAHKMVNLPNCFGEDQSFRLVSLKGMDLGTIFSVQKVKFYCNVGLSMDELLLQASRQLQEDHAARIFAAAAKEQKDTAMPFTAAQRKNLQEIHTVESLKAKLVKDAARTGADLLKPVETDPPEGASDDDMEDDATVGKKAVVKGLSSRLQKAVEEQTMAKGKQPKRKVGKQPDKKQKEDDADESAAIDSGSLELPSGLEEVAESMQSIPKCFRSLSIPRILAGEKLMRSVDAARSVADTLKKEKNYSYRFLERVISACECANALSQTLPALSRRDIQLSLNSLIQQGHRIPLEMMLQVNKRIVGFFIDDLMDVMKMRSDERAKKLEPLMSQLIDFMCCWKCGPDQSWSFTNPGFGVEFTDAVLKAFCNNSFMQLLDDEGPQAQVLQKRLLLQLICQKYIDEFNKDSVEGLENDSVLPGAKEAAIRLKNTLSPLLVLLDPVPSQDRPDVSSVSVLMDEPKTGSKKNDPNPFLTAVILCLSTTGWQKMMDEVLKGAPGYSKHGQAIQDFTAALQEETEMSISNSLRLALEKFKEFDRVMRPGSLKRLEEAMCKRLKEIGEWTVQQYSVAGLPADFVQFLQKGFSLFTGFTDLDARVRQWSAKMAKELGWNRLKDIVQELQSTKDAGASVVVPFEDIKELLDGIADIAACENAEDTLSKLARFMFMNMEEKAG